MAVLGHGNGFSFEASPYCSYATREGVHVVLAGEVSHWPGISAVEAAHDGERRLMSQRQSYHHQAGLLLSAGAGVLPAFGSWPAVSLHFNFLVSL